MTALKRYLVNCSSALKRYHVNCSSALKRYHVNCNLGQIMRRLFADHPNGRAVFCGECARSLTELPTSIESVAFT